jgi:hypothetical protein
MWLNVVHFIHSQDQPTRKNITKLLIIFMRFKSVWTEPFFFLNCNNHLILIRRRSLSLIFLIIESFSFITTSTFHFHVVLCTARKLPPTTTTVQFIYYWIIRRKEKKKKKSKNERNTNKNNRSHPYINVSIYMMEGEDLCSSYIHFYAAINATHSPKFSLSHFYIV